MKYTTIDLDSLGYLVAYHQFVKLENTTDENKVKDHVKNFIDAILQATEAGKYSLFYQGPNFKNFRRELYPDYKANRPEVPDFIKHWGSTIRDIFKDLGATPLYVIECDDALAIVNKMFRDDEKIDLTLSHNDKDMFQCPGNHYLYKNHEMFSVTEQEASVNYYTQILKGDPTDNIKGCKGVGEKTIAKLFAETDNYAKATVAKFAQVYPNTFSEELKKTKTLIKLLDPSQTYEKFEIVWKQNDNLTTISSLFE